MNSQIKAVIFDLDDTLFNRKAAQLQIFEAFKSKYADLFSGIEDSMVATAFFEADRLSAEHFIVDGGPDSIRINRFKFFLYMLNLEDDFAEEMTALYLNLYSQADAEIPGAREVVAVLSKSYRLGVVSNGLADAQYRKLEKLGLKDKFASILISEEIGLQKPEPQIFLKAAERLSVNAGECLSVGNSYNGDVIGAKNAEMKACWYNPNGIGPVLCEIQPDFEIKALRELVDILEINKL